MSNRHFTIYFVIGLCLSLLLSLQASVASAQAQFPPLNGVVADDTGRVDAAAVNSAAADLQKLGIKPLAVMVSQNVNENQIENFAEAAAENYGLIRNGVRDPNLFAVVVSLGGRQSTVIYGDGLKGAMERVRDGRTTVRIIREDYRTPKLAAGDYTGAFVETFKQAAREIELSKNPPTAVPPSVTNIDTEPIGDALLWIVGGLVLLGGLAVAGPALYKRYKQGQETAARRRVLQDQLVQARNVTADMITNLELPVDPNEQITYRFLALALERERPQQLVEVRAQYDAVYDRVAAALARYEETNKRTYTTEQEMTSAISQYQGVQAEIKAASEYLQSLADLSRQVEEQIRAAPGEVDAAKKAQAAAAEAVQKLAAAAPGLHSISAQAALRPALEELAQAERALTVRPPLSLQAHKSAQVARALAEHIGDSIGSLLSSYTTLSQHKAKVSSMHEKGLKLADSNRLLTEALGGLSAAAQQLEKGESERFSQSLKLANALIQQAGESVESAVALQAANAQALDKLKADGEAIKALIQQGAQAFDKVDEYAESSWRDIRGNGTEAQRAADEAYRLWGEASALNTISPDSPQDFAGAKERIERANRLLANARTLVAAIVDRLKHLEESKQIASSEIELARRDIATGRQFISQHDPDISPSPEKSLTDADKHLREAQEEIKKPKPDWISVVALARKANDMADKALAAARTEREAMQAKRQRANTLVHQADTSLSRAANFASIHRADLDVTVFADVKNAEESMGQGRKMLAQAESEVMQDMARAQVLDKAAGVLREAQQAADRAYSSASTQFAALEELRQEAYSALQSAHEYIRSVAGFMQEHESIISAHAVGALQEAIDTMPQWRDGANTEYLRGIMLATEKAQRQAGIALEMAESDVNDYRERQSAAQVQDVVGTLVAVGLASVLSGAGRRRDPGWGGGGIFGGSGDASGGGIFGGSGGGGGILGGGGSDSGGWGGGGSDSGGWGGGGSDSGSWGGGGSDSGGW